MATGLVRRVERPGLSLTRNSARLVVAGKPKMQAIGPCTRKLVMICYGGTHPADHVLD